MSRNTWTKYLNYAKGMVVPLGCVCVCGGGGAHLRAKGLVRTRGGGVIFKKIFSISNMYNTKSDHFSPKIKQYIYGNRISNAKS